MKVGWAVSACDPSPDPHVGSVIATNVGLNDNPEPEMNHQAMDFCRTARDPHVTGPVTYTITGRYHYDRTPNDGRVLEWGIRCGKAPPVAAASKQLSEC